ncbi:10555_t:CDS:2 [Dentiscutata erythropus]|uniref:10555_t:CDS:1 n=1 Tax=Dentiscutata erythropus TaxID=1348616 RepID=A0A9N9JQ12_9GLOM|nr:10555_t:CDS:2 [Dentiscutata erythropus]
MINRVEHRWKYWEQPLLLLSIVLHPTYKLSKFNNTVMNLTWTHIGQWLKYYFQAFFNLPSRSILSEMIKYKHEEDPYDNVSFQQFQGNLLDFWESTAGIGPELAKLAIHIHGICINSASVERLWSSMANNQQMSKFRIATPIFDFEENELEPNENINGIEENENINIQVPENSIDESIVEEEDQWMMIINQWINATLSENRVDDARDQIFLNDEFNEDFNLAGRNIHPADDTLAKWDLITLFADNLEPPSYLMDS